MITTQSEMTIDEAAARIEMAQHALNSARRVGGLTVIDGGQKTPAIGKLVDSGHYEEEEGGTSTVANV